MKTAVKPKAGGRKKAAKKAPKKAAKVKRARPVLSDEELKAEEKRLKAMYPKIITGTLRNRGEREGYGMKRTVEIQCSKRGCKNTRIVATSDLHQVKFCEACTEEDRRQRKQKARRARSPK